MPGGYQRSHQLCAIGGCCEIHMAANGRRGRTAAVNTGASNSTRAMHAPTTIGPSAIGPSARALLPSARPATADHHPYGGTIRLSPQGTPSAMGNQRRKVRAAPAAAHAQCMLRRRLARMRLARMFRAHKPTTYRFPMEEKPIVRWLWISHLRARKAHQYKSTNYAICGDLPFVLF